MNAHRPGLARSAFVEWATSLLTAASAVALAILLCATFVGVVMRYLFNMPILGANEIIQMASVVIVMLAMPGAAQAERHIRVDVLDDAIGRHGRLLGDLLARGISIYILSMLAIRGWAKLADAAEYGDATNMLAIPFWPFYGLVVLGAVLHALVLFIQLIDILRHGAAGDE